ncbi:MAG TPA: NTP transferase domain-containing protein [Gemmatimonadaceae bacterium]|nr:NTP transferase domain-containing protein [Gemmatimonadaceae bacterium]
MTWSAVVAALDDGDTFRSRVSVYLHPLAGRPIVWHVVRALETVSPAPGVVRVLHRANTVLAMPETSVPVMIDPIPEGQELVALRAAVTAPGVCVLVDGASPLVAPPTIARLLRAGEGGIAGLPDAQADGRYIAVGGEGPALASAEDPRQPAGAVRIAATSPDELIRVLDRHTLADASVALRNRLVRKHEAAGVSFVLPETTWIDADVRIGADSVIYPGAVLEGQTEIGSECVIGPYTRIVDASIGRGAELKGWNYVARTSIRNHAVLEPYVRRGFD